jgi:hypothetical protein
MLTRTLRAMKHPSAQRVAIIAVLVLACLALLVEWWLFLGAVP